jgi:acetyl-CoA acetyltransferase
VAIDEVIMGNVLQAGQGQNPARQAMIKAGLRKETPAMSINKLDIPVDKPNPLGSGISLGHPIGCTGARQMVTGMNHMRRAGLATGLICMCIGGGMGMAMIVEQV